MLIQLQPKDLTIIKFELELPAVEVRVVLVDNAVVIGADDNDVRGLVVLRTSDTGNRRTSLIYYRSTFNFACSNERSFFFYLRTHDEPTALLLRAQGV